MQTKLTLRLDDKLIQKAKNWAKTHQISLSEVVADFFAGLPDPDRPLELTPWTQNLAGVIKPQGEIPDEEEIRQEYLDYLEEKYR